MRSLYTISSSDVQSVSEGLAIWPTYTDFNGQKAAQKNEIKASATKQELRKGNSLQGYNE